MDTKKSKGNVLFWLLISAEVGHTDINDITELVLWWISLTAVMEEVML